MATMTEAEWQAFVLTGTRTGKLAVTRRDGRPHVTPVWFLLDENEQVDGRPVLLFNTGETSLKAAALRRDPRFALCVDDQEPPFSFVMLECTVLELVEDLAELRRWAPRIGGRYMGADRAEEFGARNAVPGEYLVRARVDHVVAVKHVSG
ncbi:PPOX class F420-dependent oxidoreductase [Streptacidiphilus sp. NEAU-YB345]|uniref:PPOX class F420-dependent oxidoreductase n=2 Tax=Streptacidiphilus fuscans TaxID=2789292 RepID=A0A931FHI6_9ACTN|nr:PPOX class F420-dependent oxidoreductase [Streptacidiphilus fuscans]MBF9070714.1 PPOX class F420-dependent oxidoreductase [Streptacidiphilus fuscans]